MHRYLATDASVCQFNYVPNVFSKDKSWLIWVSRLEFDYAKALAKPPLKLGIITL